MSLAENVLHFITHGAYLKVTIICRYIFVRFCAFAGIKFCYFQKCENIIIILM